MFGHIRKYSDIFGPYSDIFAHIRTYSDIFGHIRSIFGPIRSIFGHIRSIMDGCAGAGEAADAAETHVNVRKTCTCMHTLRATSDPHGHHGQPIRNKTRLASDY